MKKKFEVVKHGKEWVDLNTEVILCPECASEDIHQYMNRQSKWHGPFQILYTEIFYSCKCCGCHFREIKGKEINQVRWGDILLSLVILFFVTFVILLLISCGLYGEQDHLPIALAIPLWSSGIGTVICFCALCST